MDPLSQALSSQRMTFWGEGNSGEGAEGLPGEGCWEQKEKKNCWKEKKNSEFLACVSNCSEWLVVPALSPIAAQDEPVLRLAHASFKSWALPPPQSLPCPSHFTDLWSWDIVYMVEPSHLLSFSHSGPWAAEGEGTMPGTELDLGIAY